jgi:4'-phosphopantetheinyl transferase
MTPDIGAPAGPRVVPLAERELHVWVADLDAAHHNLDGLLSPQERERARRVVQARDARRWKRSRGLLRLLLGEHLGADPGGLRFEAGEHGKPRLAGEDGGLRFNLSHSGAIAVFAVALGVEVGVDVETRRRPRPQVLAMAERAFGRAEALRLGRLGEAEREGEFLRLWVRHEAALKCLGVGLGGNEAAGLVGRPWARELDPGSCGSLSGAMAAVAAMEEPGELLCRQWPVV